MKHTNGVTTVISHEQSDLVTSVGGQKDQPMKNVKSSVKIFTNNINNNNANITNKNQAPAPPTRRAPDMLVTNLQHQLHHKTMAPASIKNSSTTVAQVNGNGMKMNSADASAVVPDVRAKQVLKEAVDAVVNSFTKHTQGYGRGEFDVMTLLFISQLH